MSKKRLTPMIRIALAMALTVVAADRAAAAPITLSNLHIEVDTVGLIATFTAGIPLGAADGTVFLDQLNVSLFQDGTSIDDLFAGPTLLDVDPFFTLPWPLLASGLPDGTTLFRITGLVANATYTGAFELFQYGPDGSSSSLVAQTFEFSTASVPEPASLLLLATGLGAGGLLQRRRRRQARTAQSA